MDKDKTELDSIFKDIGFDLPEKFDCAKALKKAVIDLDAELKEPPVCLVFKESAELITLGTLGNILLVIGKAKSRKSFFLAIIIAAIVKDSFLFDKIHYRLAKDKSTVLYVDTEQSNWHLQLALKRICKLSGIKKPQHLITYGLRPFSTTERFQLIEYAIENTPNLGAVIIDGIRDLVNSINDEGEATRIADALLKWSAKGIHIITVLHQNKGNEHARGHLGSELINKSETVLSVTKSTENKDISIVQAEQCRNKEPSPLAFEIDENGLPQLCEDWEIKTATKKKAITPNEMDDFTIYEMLSSCFIQNDSLSYSELCLQFKLSFEQKFSKTIGLNKSKEFLSYSKTKNWLTQNKAKGPYQIGKYNTNITV